MSYQPILDPGIEIFWTIMFATVLQFYKFPEFLKLFVLNCQTLLKVANIALPHVPLLFYQSQPLESYHSESIHFAFFIMHLIPFHLKRILVIYHT